jgi:hypothetical protein
LRAAKRIVKITSFNFRPKIATQGSIRREGNGGNET